MKTLLSIAVLAFTVVITALYESVRTVRQLTPHSVERQVNAISNTLHHYQLILVVGVGAFFIAGVITCFRSTASSVATKFKVSRLDRRLAADKASRLGHNIAFLHDQEAKARAQAS